MYLISLKNTEAAARKNPTPRQNIYSCSATHGSSSKYHENVHPVIIITINIAPSEKRKSTSPLVTLASVKILSRHSLKNENHKIALSMTLSIPMLQGQKHNIFLLFYIYYFSYLNKPLLQI